MMELSSSSMPMGYVRHEPSIETATQAFSGDAATVSEIAGTAKRMIGSGTVYLNLTAYAADLLKRDNTIATSQRARIDCGADGVVLQPLGQETGICDGCSFGESAFLAWCARFVETGCGDKPRECSFLWPYLGGRDLTIVSRGDSGAIPPLSALLYHDVGVLPVDCGGTYDLQSLPPHGANSQESLCVQMRDNPRLLAEWVNFAAPFKCRVYPPKTAWDVADCLSTGRPVTFGCSYQANETADGSKGISSLYMLTDAWGRPAGHETFAAGWFTLGGRLGFIKTESWWNVLYPARNWASNRVVIQTDDGSKTLYPGQCAIWADDWMRCGPECWAIDAPGTR